MVPSDQPAAPGKIRKKTGTNNIIVVAPHEPIKNDEKTNFIAARLADTLGCYYAINEKYLRSEVNLNNINEVRAKPDVEQEFLIPIRDFKKEINEKGLKPVVVLIHGIKNKNIKELADENTTILIGIGQGNPDRRTLSQQDALRLERRLKANSLPPMLAPAGSDYCGWDRNNLNQLFRREDLDEYYDLGVQSIQLEIRKEGLRGSKGQAERTGELLAKALLGFVELPSGK